MYESCCTSHSLVNGELELPRIERLFTIRPLYFIQPYLQIVDDCPEEDLNDFLVEINILTECSHDNIVGLEESYYVNGKLWMLLEFCGAGKNWKRWNERMRESFV